AFPILLRHAQRWCQRMGKGPRAAHRIIFLQPRDGVAYLGSKYAVNGTAILAQPAQPGLHRAYASPFQNELFVGLEVVNPSPLIARRKVSRVYILPLMEQTVLVSLS